MPFIGQNIATGGWQCHTTVTVVLLPSAASQLLMFAATYAGCTHCVSSSAGKQWRSLIMGAPESMAYHRSIGVASRMGARKKYGLLQVQ